MQSRTSEGGGRRDHALLRNGTTGCGGVDVRSAASYHETVQNALD